MRITLQVQSVWYPWVNPTSHKYRILGIIMVSIMINYSRGSNTSINTSVLKADLHLPNEQMGHLFSAISVINPFL